MEMFHRRMRDASTVLVEKTIAKAAPPSLRDQVQGFGIRHPDVAALAAFALLMLVTYVPTMSMGLVKLFYR